MTPTSADLALQELAELALGAPAKPERVERLYNALRAEIKFNQALLRAIATAVAPQIGLE